VVIKLRERIQKKRTEQFRARLWLLHHENAEANSTLSIRELLDNKKFQLSPLFIGPWPL